jgi:integrase
MGLGSYPEIGLAEARTKTLEYRRQCQDGVDPLQARRAQRHAELLAKARGRTFREIAEELLQNKEAGWRNAVSRRQWRNTLQTYAHPIIGNLPVSAIDTALVMQVLAPIWAEKTETANRLRGRIEAVLDAARARGYRDGENPARWRGHLALLLPRPSKVRRVKHFTALPYAEMPGFMADLREREPVSARALEFVILTAARAGEAMGARWREIDLQSKIWIVPADRMKAGKEHRVPLSDAAVAVLNTVRPLAVMQHGSPDPNAPAFPSARRALPMTREALLLLLRRMGCENPTVHGFRSSFSDWSAECTNYPREVVEMALAHAIENRVEAAYRRGDLFEKRRLLMQEWGRFCTTPLSVGEVVPLHAAR